MDALDARIISILQRDGRATNAGIARAAGVSEGTVRRRLRQSIDDGLIKVVVDARRAGYSAEALIGIQAEPHMIDEVANAITQLDEVSWVVVTTGAYDIFAWAAVPTSEDLGVLLSGRLGTISGVSRSEAFVNLAIKKSTLGLPR